jgi:hypothetical protein
MANFKQADLMAVVARRTALELRKKPKRLKHAQQAYISNPRRGLESLALVPKSVNAEKQNPTLSDGNKVNRLGHSARS